MIVGIPKRALLALPRVARRATVREPLAKEIPTRRAGLVESFRLMMERQADLIIRGFGD